MAVNTVIYGIRKLHYAVRADASYGIPKPLPGAVQISLSPSQEDDIFNGLNCPFPEMQGSDFYGYDGTITVANLTTDFYVDVFGYASSSKGLMEKAVYDLPRCALLFETDGNATSERHCYYSCYFKRPDFNGETKTESVNISTIQIPIIIRPIEDGNIKLINSDTTSEIYKNWFKAVPL